MRDNLKRLERIEKTLNMDSKGRVILIYGYDFTNEETAYCSEKIMSDKDLAEDLKGLSIVLISRDEKDKNLVKVSVGRKEKFIRLKNI
jgi:hypothetical protein